MEFKDWIAVLSAAWWVVNTWVDPCLCASDAEWLDPDTSRSVRSDSDLSDERHRESLKRIIRGAGFVLLCGLTGMRRGEAIALDGDYRVVDELDGAIELTGTIFKGRTSGGASHGFLGPPQLGFVVDQLQRLKVGDETLLGDRRTSARLNIDLQVRSFVEFMVSQPGDRLGGGSVAFPDFGLAAACERAESGTHPLVNQRRLRVTLAQLALQHPASFAGLWLNYGHVSAAMTHAYARNAAFLDTQRSRATADLISAVFSGDIRIDAEATTMAMLDDRRTTWTGLTEDERAELVNRVAGSYHFGTLNDCLYRRAFAPPQCAETSHVDSPACEREGCTNCVITEVHAPALREALGVVDDHLANPHLIAPARRRLRAQRVVLHGQLAAVSEGDEPS